MSNTQPQCACSAFFATEDNLQQHLAEYRSREQRLQAELERCRTHSRTDGDDGRDKNDNRGECEDDPYYYVKAAGNPMGADVACEEVHDDEDERKRAYIKKTCDELCERSDKQLALAMTQCRSAVVGKKRTWEMAALDSEMSRARAEFDGIKTTALDQPHLQINESDGLHLLGSACIEPSAHPIPMQSHIELPRLAAMTEPVNTSSSRDMPTEEVYFNHGEGQTQGLDLLQDFDAPILQIMNSVPALTNKWTAENYGTIGTNTEAAVYHEL
ncbi:hypothetical protein NUU61_001382 [Penicillium alfredii]|uniref:Uncharacterized protein n=1 Tax=Penicillium alfredii TaxID=1506179 RepID=A0A9W9KN94_9EURO|nr:uncharacterized protein NUU61_001382 [Penicillium alfredii]KAJ5111752.1 hypothetical protein NUU61_001382 [Penicillium alfredii]